MVSPERPGSPVAGAELIQRMLEVSTIERDECRAVWCRVSTFQGVGVHSSSGELGKVHRSQ